MQRLLFVLLALAATVALCDAANKRVPRRRNKAKKAKKANAANEYMKKEVRDFAGRRTNRDGSMGLPEYLAEYGMKVYEEDGSFERETTPAVSIAGCLSKPHGRNNVKVTCVVCCFDEENNCASVTVKKNRKTSNMIGGWAFQSQLVCPLLGCFHGEAQVSMCDGTTKDYQSVKVGESVQTYTRSDASGGDTPKSCAPVARYVHVEQTKNKFARLSYTHPDGTSGAITATVNHVALLVNQEGEWSGLPYGNTRSVRFDRVRDGDLIPIANADKVVAVRVTKTDRLTDAGFYMFNTVGGDAYVVDGVASSPYAVVGAIDGYFLSNHESQRFMSYLFLGPNGWSAGVSAAQSGKSGIELAKENPNGLLVGGMEEVVGYFYNAGYFALSATCQKEASKRVAVGNGALWYATKAPIEFTTLAQTVPAAIASAQEAGC